MAGNETQRCPLTQTLGVPYRETKLSEWIAPAHSQLLKRAMSGRSVQARQKLQFAPSQVCLGGIGVLLLFIPI